MDLLLHTVLTAKNNGNHQRTQEQKKNKYAKTTMPESLI